MPPACPVCRPDSVVAGRPMTMDSRAGRFAVMRMWLQRLRIGLEMWPARREPLPTGTADRRPAVTLKDRTGGHLNLTVATRGPLFYAALDDSV
jgi:hypothetical protein